MLVLLLCAACGGNSKSPEDEVMATEVTAIEAMLSEHPERVCQYETNHDRCIQGIVTAKTLRLEIKAATGIPDDWRARLKKAKVTINGDKATLYPGPTGKTAHFVRRDGRWLVEN